MIDIAACLAELERTGLLPAGTIAVCCVGSVPRGWANERSDYDFTIVTDKPREAGNAGVQSVPLEPGSIPIHVTDVNGRRWELKYWSDGQIDQLLAKVSRKRFDRDGVTASSLFGIEELFIERLLTCLPLRGHDWVAQRCQQIRDGAFQSCAVARSLAESDNAIEDALGQLAAGDLPSAVLSARNALGFTVDALLESLGVFGSRTPKWRARRFQEAAPAALSFERYWHLETMADLLPDRPQEWVLAVLSTCRELELEIEI